MFPDILLICDQPVFRVSATDAVVSDSSNHKHYKGLSLWFRKSCSLVAWGFFPSSALSDLLQGSVGGQQTRSSAFRAHTTRSRQSFGGGQTCDAAPLQDHNREPTKHLSQVAAELCNGPSWGEGKGSEPRPDQQNNRQIWAPLCSISSIFQS